MTRPGALALPSTRARATSRRTASAAGSSSTSRSPRTSRSTTTGMPPESKFGWLFPRRLTRRARTLLKEFDVRGGGPQTHADALSGGNQQKVVIAREVGRDPSVLVAAQPTRGLDVGAIEFVHKRLVAERDEGRAVLLVSLELDEILSLSDRILVIYEGRDRRRVRAGRHGRGARDRDDRRRREGGGVSEADSLGATAREQGSRASRGSSTSASAERSSPLAATVLAFLIGGPRRPDHGSQPGHGLPRDLQRNGLQLALPVGDRRRAPDRRRGPPGDAARDDAADPDRRWPSHSPSAPACSTSGARGSTGWASWRRSSSGRISPACRARCTSCSGSPPGSSAAWSGEASPASCARRRAPTR